MKIVKIKGGLGNQLFQYSYAYLLKKFYGDDVSLDMTVFNDIINDNIRKPRLLKMNISLPIANYNEINKLYLFKHTGNPLCFMYRFKIFIENLLNPNYFLEKNRAYIIPSTVKKYKYFDGYWQSWRYIDQVWNDIKEEFLPNYEVHESTRKMIDRVHKENSVFIGVRKGDYSAQKSHYGSFGNTYYQKAMKYISEHVESPVFYVFSNDISWVKENIDFSKKTVFFREQEDIIDDFEELLIMAACKHSIIINSTYHWWGARINDNPEKIVIAPRRWFFDDKPIDIIPPHWIQLEE